MDDLDMNLVRAGDRDRPCDTIGNIDPTSRLWSGRSNAWPGDTPDSDTGESM